MNVGRVIVGICLCAGWAVLLAGCFVDVACSWHPVLQKIDTVPVRGNVTLNGKPIPFGRGSVTFSPMAPEAVGVTCWSGMGPIDRNGNYTVYTTLGLNHGYTALFVRKKGIPPGRYRVSVHVLEEFDRERHSFRNPQKWLIPERYGRGILTVDVVENPAAGAYDLHLVD